MELGAEGVVRRVSRVAPAANQTKQLSGKVRFAMLPQHGTATKTSSRWNPPRQGRRNQNAHEADRSQHQLQRQQRPADHRILMT